MWELIAEKHYSYSHDDMAQDNSFRVVIEVDTDSGMLRLKDILNQTGPYLRGGKNDHEFTYDVGSLSKPNLGLIKDLAAKSCNQYGRDWTAWNKTRGSAKDIIALWVETNGNKSMSESDVRKQIMDKLDRLGVDELMKVRQMLRISSDAVLESVADVVKNNSFMGLLRPLENLNIGKVSMVEPEPQLPYGFWRIRTRSGKTIIVISRNGASPSGSDIVVGNFVVGYL